MSVMRGFLWCLFVSSVLGTGVNSHAAESPQVEESLGSISFVRVVRDFNGREITSGGAAVAVHPAGYFVTDLQVISDKVLAPLWKDSPEIHAPPVAVWMVTQDETGRTRVHRASIEQLDRRRRLALLRADFEPRTTVTPTSGVGLTELGELYVLGFSYAGQGREDGIRSEGGPKPTLVQCRADALGNEDPAWKVNNQRAVTLDEGHCGGLILDSNGEARGLAACRIQGEQRIATGVPLEVIRDFFHQSFFLLQVDPGVVTDPPQPIEINIRPRESLPEMASWKGGAELAVGERRFARLELERDSEGWAGTVSWPELALPAGELERLTLRVSLSSDTGEERFSRVTDLDVVPGALAHLQPESGLEVETASVAEPLIPPTPTPKPTLSDVARRTSIGESADAVVIDNRNFDVHEIQVVKPVEAGAERYAALERVEVRRVAKGFDRALAEIDAAEQTLELLDRKRSKVPEHIAAELERQLVDKIRVQRRIAGTFREEILKYGLCECLEASWHHCYEAPCTEPHVPELPD